MDIKKPVAPTITIPPTWLKQLPERAPAEWEKIDLMLSDVKFKKEK